jgi:hypothetical protein
MKRILRLVLAELRLQRGLLGGSPDQVDGFTLLLADAGFERSLLVE